MSTLADAIQGAAGQPASVRVGRVDSLNPLVITAQGVPFEDVGTLGSYAPLVGDSVALLGQSSAAGSDPGSWLALGSVGSGGQMRVPAAVVRRTTNQSIPNGLGDTFVTFDSVMFDNAGMAAPLGTTLIVPLDGLYQVSVHAVFAANATGVRIAMASPGSRPREEQVLTNVGAALGTSVGLTMEAYMLAGEDMRMIVKQNSGAALNLLQARMGLSLVSTGSEG
jgi:hypothetical protein